MQQVCEFPGVDSNTCRWLRSKLQDEFFNLVVAGQFKRGKSSLINALLGAPLLPVGVVPLTSIVTVLRYGLVPKARIELQDGRTLEVEPEALGDYATERGNPANAKHVAQVTVEYPSEWLADGIQVIDTPGIGSVYQHNTEVTRAFLPRADAVLFILSVDQPVSRDELEFLHTISGYADKVICVLNKTDYLSASELAESVSFSQQILREALGAAVPLFPLSAKRALERPPSLANPDRGAWPDDGFPAFERALRGFFATERRLTWQRSTARALLRLLSQVQFTAQLELDALTGPLERLESALELLRVRGASIRQTQEDAAVLLEREALRLVSDTVEPQLRHLREQQLPRLLAAVEAEAAGRGRGKLSCGLLQTALQDYVLGEVRRIFDSWRAHEDQELSRAFDAACERFWRALQQHLDELVHACGELFNISFAPRAADSAWQSESRFYYKFWNEPPTLRLLSDSLLRVLPSFLGRPLIVRRAKSSAVELLETHIGRLRADLVERLSVSARQFQRHINAVAAELLTSLDQTVRRARALRNAGRAENESHESALRKRLEQISTLEGRVRAIVL